jgi:hypothetical protein
MVNVAIWAVLPSMRIGGKIMHDYSLDTNNNLAYYCDMSTQEIAGHVTQAALLIGIFVWLYRYVNKKP